MLRKSCLEVALSVKSNAQCSITVKTIKQSEVWGLAGKHVTKKPP